MKKILSIIKKNFLILLHSRLSALILIFGPIFLILILGLALGGNAIRNIETNVYIEEESSFTDSFLQKLRANSFIISETDSLEGCIKGVKEANKNLCIKLNKSSINFPIDISSEDREQLEKTGLGYDIELYVDFSKQRIVWGVISSVERVVSDFSYEIRSRSSVRLKSMLKEYASKIELQKNKLKNTKNSLDSLGDEIIKVQNDLKTEREDILFALDRLEKDIIAVNNTAFYILDIHNIRLVSSFFSLKTKINESSYPRAISQLRGIRNDVQYTERRINEAHLELKEIEEKISEIGEADIDYLSEPIPPFISINFR